MIRVAVPGALRIDLDRRRAFVSMIRDWCDWCDEDRVCVLHLIQVM